ncbi:hypothetical protein GW17_00012884 [Ensete ventricosum]|nr:hypothetical protein GW17_00012884 [Ensete ventricosum]
MGWYSRAAVIGKGEEQGAVEGDVDGQWEAVATLLCIGGEKGSNSNVKAAQLSGWQVVDEGGGSSGRRRRQRKAKGEVEEVAASVVGSNSDDGDWATAVVKQEEAGRWLLLREGGDRADDKRAGRGDNDRSGRLREIDLSCG